MPVDPGNLCIVEYPDPILREKCQTIEAVSDKIKAVAVRMVELMNEANGLGLAAPQVGLPWRMFVTVISLPTEEEDDEAGEVLVDHPGSDDSDDARRSGAEATGDAERINGLAGRVFINPVITITEPALVTHEEGCLSIPGIHVDIRRPTGITIRAIDIRGEPFEISSSDFFARICQHEFDHLNGTLIIDRMSKLDRLATRKQLKELEAAAG